LERDMVDSEGVWRSGEMGEREGVVIGDGKRCGFLVG
jgi:hypothetical protein